MMNMLSRRNFLAMTAAGCATYSRKSIASAKQLPPQPSKSSYQVKAGQGRRIGVVEYGDPLGFPVFYFHGLPTCRLEAAILSDHASNSHCRLIAIDRPGMGLSSPQSGRSITDWVDDITALANAVITEKDRTRSFSVFGFSSGGPYAIACAHRLRKAGLMRVAVVSGVKSPEFSQLADGIGGRSLSLARCRPRLARTLLTVFANRSRRRPALMVNRMTREMAHPDQHILRNCVYRDAFLQALYESLRQGPCGILEDAKLLTSRWNIPLSEINLPLSIWHGECDRTIPLAVSQKLAEQIPASQLTTVANEGHVSLLRTCGYNILGWLRTGA
jgi:pimeloyl-ACP methyl ester carboxylesterase